MIGKVRNAVNLARNMGPRYVGYRLWYETSRRSGWLRRRFPVNPPSRTFISLAEWRRDPPAFFFQSNAELQFNRRSTTDLENYVGRLEKGEFRFFSAEWKNLGMDYDWWTNPTTGYRYEDRHWTQIPDYDPEKGDIKYVWEKSRFAHLIPIIRLNSHTGEDRSESVISEIIDWIDRNPINRGPNWRCSQEISLRVLNWTFALYYYRDATALTEDRFSRIMHAIYWQIHHVYGNIHFSRIAVRNNHALTETLMLALSGWLFPFFPEAKKWQKAGAKWFVKEVEYQIYADGTFLQFSHNYHRVTAQLLTWGIRLANLHGEPWPEIVYRKATATLQYLSACTIDENGHLPNYGANDGALFFPFTDSDYRDYRPELGALAAVLLDSGRKEDATLSVYSRYAAAAAEAITWYGLKGSASPPDMVDDRPMLTEFPEGGYYLMRSSPNDLTFLKCGSYRDRPSHADNLHIDIWYRGENIMRDAGTYRYNAEPELVRYFNGTTSHNTVTLGEYDQMKKGPRFIWFHWSQARARDLWQEDGTLQFRGEIEAFSELGPNITHTRKVTHDPKGRYWIIQDNVDHMTGLPIHQYWNPGPTFSDHFVMVARDGDGNVLECEKLTGHYSGYYGKKIATEVWRFSSWKNEITTEIRPR
ncbi:alginate lyase family protein [Neolewinella litorea]|uniref:Alginate lyase family protein n=1 Tax=Neolewinella litorea TaxID=2562452 RepID=A0A4S4N986_9BACT|nr:alginate lyase family protein [Neolewinella litorea]THH34561.1 alginate lyase family protein [Neolewinella litorea]